MTKELVLTVVIRKQGKLFSAWCPELDIASDGDTVEEARTNLKEAVELYVETIVEDKRLDELLERLNITREQLNDHKILVSESVSGSFDIVLPA